MRSFLFSCVFVLTLAASAHGKLLTADHIRDVEPLLPYFSWLVDPEGNQSISSVSSGSLQERFAPLASGIPLKSQGAVWLRLVIIKSPPDPTGGPARPERPRLVMRLGELPPGGARMYISEPPGPVSAQGVWHSETVASHSDVLLPEPGLLPMSIYLRLDSMPGLWFSPTISPQGTLRPALLPSELLLPGLLIVACAACLLRAVFHRAQWALWAALFLLCVLGQAVLPLPDLSRSISVRDLPVMLAPGMALLLLPHVGRRMFRISGITLLQDATLYLCSIIGMAVCLAPLVPGMAWLARLFPLWPLLLFPLFPVCVSSLANKRPGALAFAGACAMPLLGAALTLYAIGLPNPPLLAAQGSLWGLAVGGLGLALARIPKDVVAEQEQSGFAAGPDFAPVTTGTADFSVSGRHEPLPQDAPEHSGQFSLPSLEMRGPAKETAPGLSLDISQLAERAGAGETDIALHQAVSAALSESESHEEARPDAGPASVEGHPCSVPAGQEEALPAERSGNGTEAGGEDKAMFWNPEDPAYPYAVGSLVSETGESGAGEGESSSEERTLPETDESPSAVDATGIFGESKPDQDAPAVQGALAAPAEDAPQEAREEAPSFGEAVTKAPAALKRPAADHVGESSETAPEPGSEVPEAGLGALKTGSDAPEVPYRSYGPGLLPDFAGSSDSALPAEAASRVISLTDEDFSSYPQPLLDDLEEAPRHTTLTSTGSFLFNLHSLVREVHDNTVPLAKNKGLLFSWYITPSLPALLEGDAPRLRGALSLLLQNSVQATRQGAVQLAVRKNIVGGEPGDLLFSISDSGSAERTDAGFFHAWELAARTGGAFNVDYSPAGGTQITFTVRFALPSEEAAREYLAGLTRPVRWDDAPAGTSRKAGKTELSSAPVASEGQDAFTNEARAADNDEPIIVLGKRSPLPSLAARQAPPFHLPEEPELAAMSPEQVLERQGFLEPLSEQGAPAPVKTGFRSQADLDRPGAIPLIVAAEMTNSKRKLLSRHLGDLPHEHIDAASNSQVIALIRERPVSLVIVDADMPEPDIVKTLSSLRQEERKRGQGAAPVLALTNHEAQSRRMLEAGATHTLCKPFSRDGLREIVQLAVPAFAAAMPQAAERPEEASGADGFENRAAIPSGGASASATAVAGSGQPDAGAAADPVNARPPEDPFVAYVRFGYKEHNAAARHAGEPVAPAPSLPASASDAEQQRPDNKPGPDESLPASGRDDALPVSSDAPLVRSERDRPHQEVDLLEAALRDAPSPQGKPTLVSLPPLEEATEPGRQSTPPAAPIILGLSEEDVTPHTEQKAESPLLDLILTEVEPDDAETPSDVPARPASPDPAPSSADEPAQEPADPDGTNAAAAAPAGTEGPSETGSPAPGMEASFSESAAPEAPAPEVSGGTANGPAPGGPEADCSGMTDAAPQSGDPAVALIQPEPQMFLLPGLDGEAVDATLLPLIPGLINALNDALIDARQGRDSGRTILVQEAAGRLASRAEVFGLQKLGKIGRCVERAAEADDLEAVSTLLEDLDIITKRHVVALQETFQSFLGADR